MDNLFDAKNIAMYLILINLITFLAIYIDKKKAEKGKWRIKESTLFTLVLLRRRNRWNTWNETF